MSAKKKLDWDEAGTKSSKRARNQREAALALVIKERRKLPRIKLMKDAHRIMFKGIAPADEIGDFRDQDQVPKALREVNVGVGKLLGADYKKVLDEVADFEKEFRKRTKGCDSVWSSLGKSKSGYALDQIVKLAAWAHGEWVQIHPFINGNGRTSRLWMNYVITRYGMEPLAIIRSRPDSPYGEAAAQSMKKAIIPWW